MIKKIFKLSGFKLSLLMTLLLASHFLVTLLGFNPQSFFSLMDKQVVDAVQASRGAQVLSSEIAVVAIDTKSVDRYGRWPWPRSIMSELLEVLETHYQAKVFAYDAVFSEPDPTDQATLKVINRFAAAAKELKSSTVAQDKTVDALKAQLSQEMLSDRGFGIALEKWSKQVVNGYFFFADKERVKHLTQAEIDESAERIESSAIKVIRGMNHLSGLPMYEGIAVESNIKILSPAGAKAGYFNVFPDAEDGTVRRVHLVLRYNNQYYPSLDLQILSRYLGDAQISMKVTEGGIENFKVGDRLIETAPDGSVMINYRGPAYSFPHYSVWDVIHKKVPRAALKGKILYLGATEVGVFDLRNTPVGVDFPGVEVHANLLDNMLQGDYLHTSESTDILTLAAILVLGLFVGLVVPRLGALSGALFAIALSGAVILCDYWVLTEYQTWLSFTYLLAAVMFNWMLIMLHNYFGEEKDKRFIKDAFGQYMAPQVIDQLVANPNLLKLGGERREITAFFTDIQGFSTISESLEPEELVELLNKYLTAMTDIIMDLGGTVDKFEGDAIIAFFGAPVPYEDHAKRACACAIKMQECLADMRERWVSQGKPAMLMRIGMNTSAAVVGNMGSAQRMDYTMMGDGVNLAARLEGVNKQYKTFTMISESTYKAIGEDFDVRELDLIYVVGKHEPIRIYELIGHKGHLGEERLKLEKYFSKGLELYRQQQWKEAAKYFYHYGKGQPEDRTAEVFVGRCKAFVKTPPPEGWDGVFQMTEK